MLFSHVNHIFFSYIVFLVGCEFFFFCIACVWLVEWNSIQDEAKNLNAEKNKGKNDEKLMHLFGEILLCEMSGIKTIFRPYLID